MNKHSLAFFLLLFCISSFGQITLNFPIERSVFQRNNNNLGMISISGTTPQVVDSIQVRLSDLQNNRIHKDWFLIQNQTDKGFFQDQIETEGGWYKLDIRTWKNNRIDDFNSVQKVGVGEVFIISGQSNAQGIKGFGAEGAQSDLVNVVDYFNDDNDVNPPQDFRITQLDADSDIGPHGSSPWCWGVLGDQLVARLGVPVMFFNSSWQGTLSVNWFQSAQGIPTLSAVGEGILPTDFPYKNLEMCLSYYASLFGVRSVLWMQGETDTAPGIPNYQQYYDYIGYTIRQSRRDFGYDVPWVMAQTSWVDGTASQLVIRAQQDLINTPNLNVFKGPFTDDLMIPRYDYVHFGNNDEVKGLDILANAWNESLSDDFFRNSQPILTDPLVELEASCSFFSTQLDIPNGYSVYNWDDGFRGNTKTQSNGTHSAMVLDEKQNYKISNLVNVGLIVQSANVVATTSQSSFCFGDSAVATAGPWSSVLWNTGETTKDIKVSESTTVRYEAFNSIGCKLGNSNSLNFQRKEPPIPFSDISFTISSDVSEQNTYYQCQGESITVQADQNWEEYQWNDESLGKEITITTNQNLSFQAKYNGGCITPLIEVANFRFTEPLEKPSISRNSIFSLNANGIPQISDGEAQYQWFLNGSILAETNETIFLESTGNYSLNYFTILANGLSCASELSDNFLVEELITGDLIVYPNPAPEELKIESAEVNKSIRFQIYDAAGRMALDKKIDGEIGIHLTRLSVSSLAPGLYLLKITTPEKVVIKRFAKE